VALTTSLKLMADEMLAQHKGPRTGLTSVNKIFKRSKEAQLAVTYEQVKNWLSGQYTVQAHRPQNKPKHWNCITSAGPGYNYQMDLLDYGRYRYPVTADVAYAWVLVVIDVNSRYAAVRALKTRRNGKIKGKDYLEAHKDIIENSFYGRNPKDLNLDNEFTAKIFVDYAEEQGTQLHYSEVGQFNKNAIVERFNRTLALMIEKYRFHTDNINWPSYLQDIVHNYNTTVHTTTKVTPEDVWLGRTSSKQKVKWLWNTLKKGDTVRIKLRLKTFAKGDELRFSRDEYVLLYRQGNRWKLRNLRTGKEEKNMYKEDQLKKVDTIVDIPTNYATDETEQVRETEKEKKKEPEEERREETPPPETGEGPSSPRLPSYETPPPAGEKRHRKAALHSKINRRIRILEREGLGEVEEDPDRPGRFRIVQHRALQTKAQRKASKAAAKGEEERGRKRARSVSTVRVSETPQQKPKRYVKRLKSSVKRRIKKKSRIQ